MKFAGLAWLVGALGLLPSCSGTYFVGVSSGGAGGTETGGAATAGNSTTAASGASMVGGGAGAVDGGGSAVVGGAGGSTSTGSAGQATNPGDAGPPEPDSYCGLPLASSTAAASSFATPEQVDARIQLFLLDTTSTATNLPQVTTREWAGNRALNLLASLNVPSAPGLDRFVSGWLPGTTQPKFWAAYFSSKQGTLSDLFTTQVAQAKGAGVLTDPAVLKLTGITGRGSFISKRLLCREVPLSPAGIDPLPDPVQGMSRRQQLETATASPACRACHVLTDPLGNALNHLTVGGAYISLENGVAIDSADSYTLPASGNISFTDVATLGKQLQYSCEAATCLTRQLLSDAQTNALLPGKITDSDVAQIASLFSASGGDLRQLVRFIVQSDAFLRAK